MHVAMVTAKLPSPPETTGRIRLSRLARALSRYGTVHLFAALGPEDMAAEGRRAGEGLEPFSRVVTHAMQERPLGRWSAVPEEYRVFPDALVRAVAAGNEVHPFDAVVLGSVAAGRAVEGIQRAAVVLDVPRVDSVAREWGLRGSGARTAARLLSLRGWRKLEAWHFQHADAITAARASDMPRVRAHRPDGCVYVPNGIDAAECVYRAPSQRSGDSVLFSGPLWYEPNVMSATILARQVMPEVRRRVPDAMLTIAGRSPVAQVWELASEQVRVLGTRSGVTIAMAEHAVFAVPAVAGRVPETRMLDAFASGCPVVTSVDALPDPAAIVDRHYVGAHSPLQMAQAIVRVLEGRGDFDGMGRRASALALGYDWEVVGETFARVVLAAAERRRA